MNFLLTPILILVATWFSWGIYLAIMHLKTMRDQNKLTPASKVFGYPWVFIFLGLDVLYNIVIGTVIFWEFPREWLFTARVSRLNDRKDWKGKLAKFLCKELLDPFDPDGSHCS
jgi:hypothetical protein